MLSEAGYFPLSTLDSPGVSGYASCHMKNFRHARSSWKEALISGPYGQCMTHIARSDIGQNFKNVPVVPRTKTKLDIKNSKLFYMYVALLLVTGSDPQKFIWIDIQGSLTHIAEIFKFGNVSGPRATKSPKLNRQLKIVNYFICMWHFFCRW